MIIEIRNQLKGQGFKVVLWITLLAMALLFSPALFRRQSSMRSAVVTVNNEPIETLPYERKVAQETERIHFFREQFGAQAEDFLQQLGLNNPRSMALQSLIQDELLNQAAGAIPLRISPDYVVQLLQNPAGFSKELGDVIPYYLFDEQKTTINTQRLNQYLHRYKLNLSDFEKTIEDAIKRSVLRSMVTTALYLSPTTIKNYYIENYLGKSFRVFEFSLNAFLKKAHEGSVSDEQLAAFFEKYSKNYLVPEKRSGFYWEFSPDTYNVSVSAGEIEAYYAAQKTKKYIETPAQVQVKRILIGVADTADNEAVKATEEKAQKIKSELSANPSDFDALAQKYSDDKASASKGGLLEFFKKGEKNPEFERAAFRLQHDGDISDMVVTDQGFEILQRVARKPVTYKTLTEVTPDILATLRLQKFKTLFNEDMTKFMNRSTTQELLKTFAQDKKAVAKTLDNQERNDESRIVSKLFKLKVGDWAFFVEGDKGYALQLKSIEKAHKPELEQAKEKVRSDYFLQKARELQEETLKQAANLAREHKFDEIKKLGGLEKQYGPLKKDDKEKIKDLIKQGVPVEEMLALSQLEGTSINSGGHARDFLIYFESREPFVQAEFDAQKSKVTQALYADEKSFIERGFVASLYRTATLQFIEPSLNTQEENLPYD